MDSHNYGERMTRLRAFFVHLTRVRTPNHTDLVQRLEKLERYPAPRPSVVPLRAKVQSVDAWINRWAPEHKRKAS